MSITAPLPNFDKAEFHGDPPAPDQCAYCHRGLATEYYRVDGNLACSACAQQAQSLVPPDSHKAYSRAVLFGVGAAIVGFIGYSLIMILTGWTIGYAAIGVGWLVGKAMIAGSKGLGGRRYQITAALLTYAAVAVAFVPMMIHQQNLEAPAKQAAAQHAAASPSGTAVATPARPVPSVTFGGFLKAALLLLGIGLISPILEVASSPASGAIGLFIIFIGISTAWRLTHRAESSVDGPFEQTPARS